MIDQAALREHNHNPSSGDRIPYWTTPEPEQSDAWLVSAERLAKGLAEYGRVRAFIEPNRWLVGFCAGSEAKARRLAASIHAQGVEAVVACGHGDGRGKADDVCLPCRPGAQATEIETILRAVTASLTSEVVSKRGVGGMLERAARKLLGAPDESATGVRPIVVPSAPFPVLLFPGKVPESTRETIQDGVVRLTGVNALVAVDDRPEDWASLTTWTTKARAEQVVILPVQIGQEPGLLNAANRLKQQLGSIMLDVRVALPIASHPGIVQAIEDRVALAGNTAPVGETAIVLAVPDGDPEANAEMARLARLVYEKRRNGLVEIAFLEGSSPSLADVFWRVERLGARACVVVPVAIDREIALPMSDSSLDLRLARPLAGHPGVATALTDRFQEALTGTRVVSGVFGASHSHGGSDHSHAILPPRYRGNVAVSAAPMGAAPVVYDDDGQVAWNDIWGDFCELALAGGPPHRGSLLEPVTPDEVAADRAGYSAVVSEIVRGFSMVTDCEVIVSQTPGWVGLRCDSEEMAIWLLRAITVENVAVRREGNVLFLPAGPKFRLEHEIKNVITVVAKTTHYWKEHIAAV